MPWKRPGALAPWAHSVHLKDQAVQLYDNGFLLADIPLGQGALRLEQIVEIVRGRQARRQFLAGTDHARPAGSAVSQRGVLGNVSGFARPPVWPARYGW